MGSGLRWGLWIAACLLIVGAAKFVDEYHIRNEVRSRVRDGLIAVFLFLDQPRIANFPGLLYQFFANILKTLGTIASVVAVAVTYFAIVACFYFGRSLVGDPPGSFMTYSLTWINSIFWAIVVLWGICTSAASFITVSSFLDRWNRTNRLYHQWIIASLMLLTIAMIALGTAVGFFVLGSVNPELGLPGIVSGSGVMLVGNPLFLLTLSAVCLWHAIALGAAMIVLTVFRSLYLFIHRIALSVLSAA